MWPVKFSLRALIAIVFIVAVVQLITVWAIPYYQVQRVVNDWKGISFGSVDYFSREFGGGGVVDAKWNNDIEILLRHPSLSLPQLNKALYSVNEEQRLSSTIALQYFRDRAEIAVPKLLHMLKSDRVTRDDAIGCLIKAGVVDRPEVRRHLIELYNELSENSGGNELTLFILDFALVGVEAQRIKGSVGAQEIGDSPEPSNTDDRTTRKHIDEK